MHGVSACKYWDFGEDDREFKFNNYISRYHHRHLDLMDLLALYQPRANAPLDAMARLCGLPGKLGMDGSAVHAAWLAGRIEDIRRYCETDVMNTYLLYCRYQLMRGGFTRDGARARDGDGARGAGRPARAALGRIPGRVAAACDGRRLTRTPRRPRGCQRFPGG